MIAKNIKKNILIFKNLQKMVTKLRQFAKPGPFSTFHFFFFNCANFVTIFCRVSKEKIFFLNIPCYPPPFAIQNCFAFFCCLKYPEISFFFDKIDLFRTAKGRG